MMAAGHGFSNATLNEKDEGAKFYIRPGLSLITITFVTITVYGL